MIHWTILITFFILIDYQQISQQYIIISTKTVLQDLIPSWIRKVLFFALFFMNSMNDWFLKNIIQNLMNY